MLAVPASCPVQSQPLVQVFIKSQFTHVYAVVCWEQETGSYHLAVYSGGQSGSGLYLLLPLLITANTPTTCSYFLLPLLLPGQVSFNSTPSEKSVSLYGPSLPTGTQGFTDPEEFRRCVQPPTVRLLPPAICFLHPANAPNFLSHASELLNFCNDACIFRSVTYTG